MDPLTLIDYALVFLCGSIGSLAFLGGFYGMRHLDLEQKDKGAMSVAVGVALLVLGRFVWWMHSAQ